MDKKTLFAETMYNQHDFPKGETSFDALSKYIEELAHADMSATVFDELWELYIDAID